MRIGYSLTASEIVAAAEIEYGDCAKFQIVCPECREAVFKGRRERGGTETHYLSHYRALTPDARECEMRVETLARSLGIKDETPGHGQTLHQFMHAFRSGLCAAADVAGIIGANDLRKAANSITYSPLFDEVAVYLVRRVEFEWRPLSRDETAAHLRGMAPFGGKSAFWARRQASYIVDVKTHLETSQGEGNLRWLAACAMAITARRPEAFFYEDKDKPCVDLCRAMAAGKAPSLLRGLFARLGDDVKEARETGHAKGLARATAKFEGLTKDEAARRIAWQAKVALDPAAAVRVEKESPSSLAAEHLAGIAMNLLRAKGAALDTEIQALTAKQAGALQKISALRAAVTLFKNSIGLLGCVRLKADELESIAA